MGIGEFLGGLLKPAAEAYKARQERKQALEQAEHESDMAAERAWQEWRVKNIESDAAWETESIRNSGVKDDVWTYAFVAVFIGGFIPGLQEYVAIGIQQLDSYPTWFQIVFVSVIGAAFGIRFWRRK